ncbi:putative monooxygenase [Frankia sp. AiPs1]|uniref:cupin domain-containing protein n=1 Tax=Frankia sp. AiPa1 TaxID=573492 RepID=UPI00202B2AFB|nr:cupin domain-containing protein [Frankia sp. AiPa1]MCL9761435.1 cupin domain-containing protein [Frankia sp. AiPa1]
MTAPVTTTPKVLCIHDVAPNRRRGGDIRTLLSPATVGSTSGFLGTLTLEPGEVVTEHWHPYSEEFLFCVRGSVTARLDGQHHALPADSGVCIPIGMRHRIVNTGEQTAFLVFHLSPLAPRPDLGHVDTETIPNPHVPHTPVILSGPHAGHTVHTVHADGLSAGSTP